MKDSCVAVSLSPYILGILSSYLLVHIELPEDLRCVQQMLVLKDPVTVSIVLIPWYSHGPATYFFPFHANRGRFRINAIQYPLMRNKKVRKACTAASGMM